MLKSLINKLNSSLFLTLILILSSLTGCNEYWWKRGQAPSTNQSYTKAKRDLAESKSSNSNKRVELIDSVNKIEAVTDKIIEVANKPTTIESSAELKVVLYGLRDEMIKLEGKVVPPSKPAEGELNSQLRAIIQQIEDGYQVDTGSVKLYATRIVSFLARELKSPVPV